MLVTFSRMDRFVVSIVVDSSLVIIGNIHKSITYQNFIRFAQY